MERKPTLDGHDLRAMFTAGTSWLEKIVPDINALNVYPVPDGDCGTNMLLTMRASLAETARLVDGGIGSVADAIARGALMGARGNSGVILSQIWRGLAQELKDKKIIDAKDLAQALQEAAETAYLALSNPVEGTILTVMRDAASAAGQEATSTDASSVSVLAGSGQRCPGIGHEHTQSPGGTEGCRRGGCRRAWPVHLPGRGPALSQG